MVESHVYVISAGADAVKIGYAKSPEERLRRLQTGHYQRLRVAHYVACAEQEAIVIERVAHNSLSDKHVSGEWFKVTPDEGRRAVDEAFAAVRSGAVVALSALKKEPVSDGKPKRLIVNHIIRGKPVCDSRCPPRRQRGRNRFGLPPESNDRAPGPWRVGSGDVRDYRSSAEAEGASRMTTALPEIALAAELERWFDSASSIERRGGNLAVGRRNGPQQNGLMLWYSI